MTSDILISLREKESEAGFLLLVHMGISLETHTFSGSEQRSYPVSLSVPHRVDKLELSAGRRVTPAILGL